MRSMKTLQGKRKVTPGGSRVMKNAGPINQDSPKTAYNPQGMAYGGGGTKGIQGQAKYTGNMIRGKLSKAASKMFGGR